MCCVKSGGSRHGAQQGEPWYLQSFVFLQEGIRFKFVRVSVVSRLCPVLPGNIPALHIHRHDTIDLVLDPTKPTFYTTRIFSTNI